MKYPLDLVTLLLVDDSSSEKFKIPFDNLRFIKTSEFLIHPRKTLSTAIPHVKPIGLSPLTLIVVHENWLLTIDTQTNDVAMIAGAVTYEGSDLVLHHFQQLDFASLHATMGSQVVYVQWR
jgi:hypothetical protein